MYAANLVLYGMCGLFLTGMYIVMIIIGLRFVEIQGTLFLLGTLFALLVDVVILDPVYILECLVVRHIIERVTTIFQSNKE